MTDKRRKKRKTTEEEIDGDNLANDFNEDDVVEDVIEEKRDESITVTGPVIIPDAFSKNRPYQSVLLDEQPKMVSVRDSYLPGVLVRLGLFSDNRAARRHIRDEGIKLNDKIVSCPDATNQSSNFEITFDGKVYQIFVI